MEVLDRSYHLNYTTRYYITFRGPDAKSEVKAEVPNVFIKEGVDTLSIVYIPGHYDHKDVYSAFSVFG